jgi:hypothetical protein
MSTAPEFLSFPLFANREEIFAPARPHRRGEVIAWLCAAGVGIAIGIINLRGGTITSVSIFLLIFFLGAGILISLGNWMDANTQVVVAQRELTYQNPLRTAVMPWESITSLEATSARGGWRAVVEDQQTRFAFTTAVKVRVGSRVAILGGFPHGDRMAALIRGMAGLSEPQLHGRSWISARS